MDQQTSGTNAGMLCSSMAPRDISIRLGPPALRRRRTFDPRIERCAPAVPQHDRARTSVIPLPAHRPCTVASQLSPAAIVPYGDMGCLIGFRQEVSPHLPRTCDAHESGEQFCLRRAQVHDLCQPRRSSEGKLKVPKLEPQNATPDVRHTADS